MQTSDSAAIQEIADLERLGMELTALGYRAEVRTIAGRLPYLEVWNPCASVLAEKVYVQGGWFWFSWAERIAECGQVATAAATLGRVLRTVDGDTPAAGWPSGAAGPDRGASDDGPV